MKNKKGFTLAEIIISMTIIGVIAAVTIPALLVSTNEKTMEAQKKALTARMSQAISQIEDLRVYETTATSSALNFVTKALNKVYRITKTCDVTDITKSCDFPAEIALSDGGIFKISENANINTYMSSALSLDTEVAGFVTANGESIAVYYNPKCHGAKTNGFYGGPAATAVCINMIYDLNGSEQAPNEVGKDVGFISVFFPKDPDITLPITYATDVTDTFSDYTTAIEACKNQNHSLIIPNWEDGMSMALNKKLTGMTDDTYLVTGAGSTSAYKTDVSSLITSSTGGSFGGLKLRCVYNN